MREKQKWNDVVMVDSIKEILEMAARKNGDGLAFEFRDEVDREKIVKVTYKEFKRDTEELGSAIVKLGMHDKHVAIIGENSYKWLTCYLTILKSTGVFVPIDKELTCEQVINVLRHSDSEMLFYSAKYENWIDEIKEVLPNVKYFVGLNRKEDKSERILSYDKLKEQGKKELNAGNNTYLNLKDDSVIVDCTLGYAGHSSNILSKIPNGKLYAFDQDDEAIASSKERLSKIGSNFEIIRSNFVNIKEELNKRGFT